MNLHNFLKLNQGGSCYISIQQEPYDDEKHRYTKTYFEEECQENILNSDTYKAIAKKKIDHFNIIGGGMYKVELCIYLQEEN